jgi:hypothetical protein
MPIGCNKKLKVQDNEMKNGQKKQIARYQLFFGVQMS